MIEPALNICAHGLNKCLLVPVEGANIMWWRWCLSLWRPMVHFGDLVDCTYLALALHVPWHAKVAWKCWSWLLQVQALLSGSFKACCSNLSRFSSEHKARDLHGVQHWLGFTIYGMWIGGALSLLAWIVGALACIEGMLSLLEAW